MISDLRTSIVSAMLDICLLCCAMTVFRVLISRSSASVLELPSPIAGVVGVANPDVDDACFEVGTANSSGYSIVSYVIISVFSIYLVQYAWSRTFLSLLRCLPEFACWCDGFILCYS